MTIEHIQQMFDLNQKVTNNKIVFHPEIKIKRNSDTLYISELRKTKLNALVATVEVYNPQAAKSDKAPTVLSALDEISLRAIYIRLTA